MSSNVDLNSRPDYDDVIKDIAEYVTGYNVESKEAIDTARNCLIDSIGCGLLALQFKECTKHLGPIVENTKVPFGSRVPGTNFILDPVKAAWDIGCTIRWLDYNDTWLAAEWGHPSDNLGSILGLSDHLSQKRTHAGETPIYIKEILELMVKAHEIQGVLAIQNSFNRVGLDHVLLVRVASTAVSAKIMGATKEQTLSAISHSWVDGSSLRTYRHAPNAGSRKSWAAGDASSRGVRLADIAFRGEMGVPGVLSAPQWGFYDISFNKTNRDQKLKEKKDQVFNFNRKYDSYVMEHILFKIKYPAEFHAQTAVEAAVKLYENVKSKLNQIEKIVIRTQEPAIRIISKEGKLSNAADRDHCIQYMTAIGLLKGDLVAEDYEDDVASDPRIDELRGKMVIQEDERYTKEYLEEDKRSIANAIVIHFKDGSSTEKVEVEYPIGHRRRREQGIPLLIEKFKANLSTQFSENRTKEILSLCEDQSTLENSSVIDFMNLMIAE